jgi:hypothetical protein
MAHRNQSTQLTVEVKYIDFGYTSAKYYFVEVILSAYDRFRENLTAKMLSTHLCMRGTFITGYGMIYIKGKIPVMKNTTNNS